jgi:hypothetical protein
MVKNEQAERGRFGLFSMGYVRRIAAACVSKFNCEFSLALPLFVF